MYATPAPTATPPYYARLAPPYDNNAAALSQLMRPTVGRVARNG